MSENNPDYSPSIKCRFVEEPSQLRHSSLSKIESNAATKVGQEIRADSVSKSSASSREHGTILAVDTEQFIIGQKVWVGGVSPGQIAYIGETHFAPGEWAGIVLDEPNGKNDGCVAGKRYFQCESKKGIFSRLTRLTLHPLGDAVDKRAQNYSPDRSRTVSPTPSTQSVLNRKGGRHGFKLGDRVIVSSGFGSRPGTLRFLGVTQFAPGNWCGIELDDSTGKNDGSVEGVRYFECEAKYGIFVPITKVSLSPKKSRLSRAGSRESLTSVGTMNSIATTNTSRLRMQRYSMSIKQPTPSTSKNYFSMQDLLKEKQNHIEQLMIERDMEQEDAQNQALQFQKIILELKSKIESMEKNLDEEKNKTEDLQLSIEEANFCGDELSAQTQVYKERIADLEQRLRAVTTGDENIQRAIDPVKYEVKTEITCTPESKYDSDKKNNQYSFNQNEEPKIENLDTTEALNNFRDLFRKIKDSTSSDATYQDELNRYVQDPNEIRSINLPLNQMGDKFLRDLCESLALSIKEFNLMCIENKNIVTKCINLQNTLENSRREIESIENGKIEIFKNVEELTSNCKNISKANEKLQEENNTFKETIKRLEHENLEITENLQVVTSNCERFVGINKQLQREIESLQKSTKQIEKEKSDASQKLEAFVSNYKNVSEIYSKMETELKTNADNSNLVKGEEFDVSSMFENISSKCRTLSVQNSNLLKNLQTSEDKLNLLVTQKFDVEGENTKLLTKLNSSSELNAKLQQELQVSEENSSQFKKEIIDVSRKLEEMSMNCKILSDVKEKLKDDLKTSAEKLKNMDEEKSEVYKKLEETTLICKNYESLNEKIQQVNEGQLLIDETTTSELSELNDKLRAELAGCYEKLETIEKQKFDISLNLEEIKIKFESQLEMSHDNYKLLEAEKFDISQKLENVQSTLQTTLEQNENLQEKLKSIQENSNHLEKEKFEISKKFREVYLSLNSSLEQNEKISHELTDLSSKLKVFSEQNLNLQQQLKSLEEKNKDNEAQKLELTFNINKVSSAYENLFEQNLKLKEELLEQKNTVKQLEETNFKLYRNLEEVNCKNEILTELSNKLEQKLKTMKNTPKKLDVQNAEAFETLESVTTYCMKLENIKEMLQQDIKLINEKYKQNELEKTEISQKLNDIITGYINLSEDFGKLEHQLKGNESNQLASEKIDISGNLQEATLQTANLLDLSESLQQKYNIIELKCGQLKAEKLEIFQKFQKLSELNNHLEQELEDFEEKINELEAESYYFSENIIDSTPEGKTPSELNEKMLQKIKENEDECTKLELQKLEGYDNVENSNSNNVQQNLEDNEGENKSEDKKNFDLSEAMGKVNTSCENLSELNDQLRNYLKNNKDQIDGFKNERSKLIQNIKSISGNLVDLSKLYQKIQFGFKTNRSNNNQLEELNFNVLKEIQEFKSSQKNLPDLNNELQKEVNTSICDDVSVKSENLIQTSPKNPEESERETEYFNNALSNNDTLRCFSQGVSKIEAEINKNQQCDDDAISTTGHSNIEIFLSNDSISKNCLYLIEKCKNQQNVHNEFIIALLYIHQLISSMKIHIENLDKDIQCIPSENRIETDLLSVVEEKSCKLRYDSIDLARRFKCLVIINENYPSLKDSILSILDEPKKNIIEQEACMVIEEVQLLQNIVESYQLLLKANDVEIASNIIAKSSLEPLSTKNRSDKSIMKNLQSDLELTKRLFNKLEELNFILKCLRYFQLKISKQNDKVSLEDVSLNVSDTEKKLKVECSELIKILVNSIKTFKNSRECSDKSKSTKSELIASILHIDKSIKIINNVMNSKSELLNLLYEKVKSMDENYTDFSSEPLTTDTSKLDAYTKTGLKSKQFDEKTAQIDFLHSIIADMQQKNDKLKDKIETLETFSTDNRNCMYKMIHARKPAPRIFCDICDQFDIHETEDCPMQESDGELSFQPDEKEKKENDGTNIMKPLTARKYCENCEAFGDHATEVCCAGLE